MNNEKYYISNIKRMRIEFISIIVMLVLMLVASVMKQESLRSDLREAENKLANSEAYELYLEMEANND